MDCKSQRQETLCSTRFGRSSSHTTQVQREEQCTCKWLHLLSVLDPPMNMSLSIDKIQAANLHFDWMKIQPSTGLGVKATCVVEDADVSGTVSVPRHVETLWQSFVHCLLFVFFSNVMTITTACTLHCTRSVSLSSGLFLHCVAGTGLKYQVALVRVLVSFCRSQTRDIIREGKQSNGWSVGCCRRTGFFSLQPVEENLCSLCWRHVCYSTVLIAKFTADSMNWDI